MVKLITGDHKVTAAAIAKELGMEGGVVSGAELDSMSDADPDERVESIAVLARVAPEHKVRIVAALRRRGHIAAMTGNGINDAPALKHADIGVAMGITGTEVTKEAASMVLTDDYFATIVGAVKEGRTIYDNMVKFVRFQLSTNIGAIFTVLAATLMGLPTPLTAIQILSMNIIMDGPPAVTLGVDPARPGIMNEPPRDPSARMLTGSRLLRLVFFGAIMCVGTLAMFFYGRAAAGEGYGLTLAFTTFVIFQFFNVFNARAEFASTFDRNCLRNWKLWAALMSVLVLQAVVVPWPPAQGVFDTPWIRPRPSGRSRSPGSRPCCFWRNWISASRASFADCREKEESCMNTKQDELCVDVLAAIAWADSEVSEAELDKAIDLIDRMEYVDRPRLQEILVIPHNMPSSAKLETLDRKTRVRLLHDAYLLADYCGGVDTAELELLQAIAATILPESRWEEARECLEAYAKYEHRCDGLWGVTHLG